MNGPRHHYKRGRLNHLSLPRESQLGQFTTCTRLRHIPTPALATTRSRCQPLNRSTAQHPSHGDRLEEAITYRSDRPATGVRLDTTHGMGEPKGTDDEDLERDEAENTRWTVTSRPSTTHRGKNEQDCLRSINNYN